MGYIHWVGDTFIGLVMLIGSRSVLSRLCIWWSVYISFINGLRFGGDRDLMGEMVWGKWIGMCEGCCVWCVISL